MDTEAVCAQPMWGWDVTVSGSHRGKAWMYKMQYHISPWFQEGLAFAPSGSSSQTMSATHRCLATPKRCRPWLWILLSQASSLECAPSTWVLQGNRTERQILLSFQLGQAAPPG